MMDNEQSPPADAGRLDQPVRPAAWLREQRDVYDGKETLDPFFVLGWPQPKNFAHGATYEPLYDQAALAAAVAAERERCAHVCRGIAAGHAGMARRLTNDVHSAHASGKRDGANECAAAILKA